MPWEQHSPLGRVSGDRAGHSSGAGTSLPLPCRSPSGLQTRKWTQHQACSPAPAGYGRTWFPERGPSSHHHRLGVCSLGRAGRCRGNMKAGPWGLFGPFTLLAPFSLPPPSCSPCILCPQLLAWGLSDPARGPCAQCCEAVRANGRRRPPPGSTVHGAQAPVGSGKPSSLNSVILHLLTATA